jgi:hypothetical protein
MRFPNAHNAEEIKVQNQEGGLQIRGRSSVLTRVRVFWESEKKWFEGYIKTFAPRLNKYNVQYDHGECYWEEYEDLYAHDSLLQQAILKLTVLKNIRL